MNFIIKSTSFNSNEVIPTKYTSDGENISPPLEWKNPPTATKSFVLMVDDYDAPNGLWNHWIIYNILSSVNKLEEGIKSLPKPAKSGINSWKKNTYMGPYFPNGEHVYHFKLFALDEVIKPHHRIARTNIEDVIKHHLLGQTEFIGRYTQLEASKPIKNKNNIADAIKIIGKKNVNQIIKEKACKEIEKDALNK